MEETKKRIRRTPQQIAEDIDMQIEKLEASIAGIEDKKQAALAELDQKESTYRDRIRALQERKEALLSPKPPRKRRRTKKQKLESILKQAQKSGMKPEEIAEKLGVELA